MRTRLAALTLLVTVTAASLATAGSGARYVWQRGQGSMVMMNGNLDEIGRFRKQYGNEYIWIRQPNGAQYVITDRAVLNEVAAAYAELDRAQAPMEQLERRMHPHEEEMDRLSDRIEALAEQLGDENLSDARRRDLERRMNAIEKEMNRVEEKMESVSGEMERLSDVIERESAKAERRFETIVARAIRAGKAKRVH